MRLILSFSFLFLLFNLKAQYSVTVIFTNIESDKGEILVSILDANENSVDDAIISADPSGSKVIFKNIPKGKYTIKAFHDENSNRILDTGTFGIPKEDYGFSNNARGNFGPPDYEDQLFEVNSNTTQRIELR